MYGVNSGVNFPSNYGYGKNTKAQSPYEQHNTPETKTSGRTDEILFSATYRKENSAVSSLSDDAKNLLAELREKYKGYDFMVADFETDEEASQLLSQGKGEYNVLITPDLLEKMASDKSERAKYEDIIAGASEKFGEIEKNLTEGGKSIVEKLGFTVKSDGTVDYYANLHGIKGASSNSSITKSVKSSLVDELSRMVNQIAENRAKALEDTKKRHEEIKVEKNDKEIEDPNKLSDKARAVLNELMDKYQGYDFIVGRWKTDEEASRVLSYGRGRDGNVLITPELLEEMAADESVKAKYMGIIDDAAYGVKQVKEDLTEGGKSVVDRVGVTVNSDGTLTYFAKLVKGLTAQDGSSFMHASTVKGLADMLNAFAEGNKVNGTDKSDEIEDPNKLSDKARAVLYELMDKYNYHFIIGRWKTDEEASRVLSYGMGKDGNVIINPDLLEKMAADESVKAEYMGIIDKAASDFNDVKNGLTNDVASIVEKLGMTIGDDGSVSYFAKLVDGVTTDDGANYIKCSIIEDFTKSLEVLAKTREKILENKDETDQIKLDTPEEKKEKVEKSVMPPKSYEKYEKEENPYSTEEDYGTLPPESFKKYQTEDDTEIAGEVMNYSI